MSEQERLREYEQKIATLEEELATYQRIVTLIGSQEPAAILPQPASSAPARNGELSRDILEHLSDGFAQVRPDGTLSYYNAAFAELLSLPADAPQTLRLMDVQHLASCEPFAEAMRTVLSGTSHHAQCTLTDAKGQRRVVECTATAVPAGDQSYGAALVIRDQTEHEQMLAHLAALNRVALALTRTLNFEERLDTALLACREATAADAALIYLIDEGRQTLSLARASGFSSHSVNALRSAPWSMGEGLLGGVVQAGAPRLIAELSEEHLQRPGVAQSERLVSAALVPLRDAREITGVLGIYTRARRMFAEADVRLLLSMASHVGLSLNNAQLHKEMQRQAHHDSLTGLLNRGHLMEMAQREYHRARRNRSPLIVLMIDVDRFKAVNDTSGHGAGDLALQAIARMLHDQTRTFDLVGRYGGDEFVVVLVDCTHAYAFEVIRRLHQAAQAIRIPAEKGEIELTLSVGMAACRLTENETLSQVLVQADQAMYAVKNRRVQANFNQPAVG